MKLVRCALVVAAVILHIACQDTSRENQAISVNPRPSPPAEVSPSPTALPQALPTASASTTPLPSPATPRPQASPTASPKLQPPATSITVDTASSRAVYLQHCAACHGRGGAGSPDGAPALKGVAMTEQRAAKVIAGGGEGMPAFKGRLTPKQITDLARFICQGL